jgi:uncharacterized protein (UPF0335 family)
MKNQLLAFIETVHKLGWSDKDIASNLRAAGYDLEDLVKVLRIAYLEPEKVETSAT